MARNFSTIYQDLSRIFTGNWQSPNDILNTPANVNVSPEDVIYKTDDPVEYQKKMLELQQDKYLQNRWKRVQQNLTMSAFAGLSNIKLMYRDADLMDAYPEIGAALDILSEEGTLTTGSEEGMIVNVSSSSDRIKSILEDLFVNRLNMQVTAQMVMRGMIKYGNEFMLLDIDRKLGIKGWRRLPVGEVERIENGIVNPYGAPTIAADTSKDDMTTKFIWTNELGNSMIPFRNWQIAHFRLLHNSMFLPYGCSGLMAARRHFRMLALMEDMMLIYRLERSMERRVYKIYVGALDDADIPSYVENIANSFKRTPIVDPLTGQLDLRKNILPVWKKTPIPLLDGRTITIEDLAKEYEDGKVNYVYSVQDNTHKIVSGKVVWCGKNYTANELYKITLDDDSYMVMAGEHEIIMRDGSKKRADAIAVGESVMPFYRMVDKKSKKLFDRYEKVYNPNTSKYEFTHRLVAQELIKEDEKFNTVHHKDFNKYNNSPENLLWCDYFEHHKMHSDLVKKLWADPDKRKLWVQHLSDSCKGRPVTDEQRAKISNTLKKRYQSGELDYVRKISSEFLKKFNQTPARLELNERTRLRNIKIGYPKYFKEYNESELHKEHDKIRRIASAKSWIGQGRTNRIEKMNIHFDDFVWNELLNQILAHNITNRKSMLDYINNNLIEHIIKINCNERLNHNRFISKTVLNNRIHEKGFKTITEFVNASLKNHKVKNIEIINGDDVYCMTVVGLNGEEDRHNFAIRTFKSNESWNESGCFVSNCASDDIFIPVRDPNAPTPIDTLAGAKNLDAIDDIKYIQKKVCAALRIPQSFLNFEEQKGDGKNLALMDVRFARTINKYQQAFLMELTKIATIHLFLLGFEDDLTNFTLTMNNPSTQAEQLEIENSQKKITAVRDAVSDPGNGIPVMSLQRALKTIMKWSEKDIKDNFEEIRLEKALSAELEKTSEIIKRTGIFDSIDRIYGEPGAQYQESQGGQEGMDGMGGAPSGGGGGFGGGIDDFGAPGAEDADVMGQEGMEPTAEMGGGQEGMDSGTDTSQPTQPMESVLSKKPLLKETKLRRGEQILFEKLMKTIDAKVKKEPQKRVDVYDKTLMVNEEVDKMIGMLDEFAKEDEDAKEAED